MFKLITFIGYLVAAHCKSDVCYYDIPFNYDECRYPHRSNFQIWKEPDECSPNIAHACSGERFLAVVETLTPFSDKFVPVAILNHIFPTCCPCNWWKGTTLKKAFNYTDLSTVFIDFKRDANNTGLPGIAWPILGNTNAEQVNGYPFASIFELSEGIYMTLPPNKEDKVLALITGIADLSPLLLICLLLAFIAGFFGWIMETWNNEEEFQREFIQGVWNGFWWSFVSMTTVGYGDKSPRSVMARIFSVLWILVGITICSMFTASLTNAITEAGIVKLPEINAGSKVGILPFRMFETSLVARKGGIPVHGDSIQSLINKLKNEEIDGILMDPYTKLSFMMELKDRNYLENRIPWTEQPISYGVIFSNLDDYKYFGGAIRDNKMMVKTCLLVALTNVKMAETKHYGIFSPESGLFYPFLGACLACMVFICIFGIFYESRRKSKGKVSSDLELKEKGGEMKIVQPVNVYDNKEDINISANEQRTTAKTSDQIPPPFY